MGFIGDTVGILFPFWAWPYLSILICLAIIGIEGKSVLEHAKKHKSRAAEIPHIVEDIINCVNKTEAIDLLTRIKQLVDEDSAKYHKE